MTSDEGNFYTLFYSPVNQRGINLTHMQMDYFKRKLFSFGNNFPSVTGKGLVLWPFFLIHIYTHCVLNISVTFYSAKLIYIFLNPSFQTSQIPFCPPAVISESYCYIKYVLLKSVLINVSYYHGSNDSI